MNTLSERLARRMVVDRLAELLEQAGVVVDTPAVREDYTVKVGSHTFAVEWRGSGSATSIAKAIEHLEHRARKTIPLVAVPFMGDTGQKRCDEAGVGWLDLSGNARITARGLYIHIQGQPNRFSHPGRPSSVFAPKSARIVRAMLIDPERSMSQRELARETDMGEGYTSRIVARLEQLELVERDASGAIRPRDPELLLDAWAEVYDFTRHHIIKGHVAARSGGSVLTQLAHALKHDEIDYAATGLAAAWLLDRFAGFRIVTLYLRDDPSAALLRKLLFREDARGANVWLVVPNDAGVFHGAAAHDRINCVHPVQAWLDLKDHPERASEAAEALRATFHWKQHQHA